MNRDAVVYKMHGDADRPANVVLTKDDYVLYDKRRPLFRTVLKGDFISKTFLFSGFSFEDPILDYILNQIHALMDKMLLTITAFSEEHREPIILMKLIGDMKE